MAKGYNLGNMKKYYIFALVLGTILQVAPVNSEAAGTLSITNVNGGQAVQAASRFTVRVHCNLADITLCNSSPFKITYSGPGVTSADSFSSAAWFTPLSATPADMLFAPVAPPTATRATISVCSDSACSSISDTRTINIAGPKRNELLFSFDPAHYRLVWATSGMKSCQGVGVWSGPKALTGSEVIPVVTVDSNYRMVCLTKKGDVVTKLIVVGVKG